MREGNGVFSEMYVQSSSHVNVLSPAIFAWRPRVCDIHYGVLIRTNLLDMDTSPWHATILPHGLERGH
jgi:hypothetical protein